MTDTMIPLAIDGGQWPNLKACDNGDGTYSIAVVVMPTPTVSQNLYRNIISATTTIVKSGAGILRSVIFNKANSLTSITVYDNTAGSGTKIGTVTNPLTLLSSQFAQDFNCGFNTGLTIVTSGTDDITIVYQ